MNFLAQSIPMGSAIFVLVSFLILMLILKKVAYMPIMDMLDKRAEQVSKDLDGAEASRLQAESLASQRSQELEQARLEAVDIKKAVEEQARKASDQSITDAQNQAVAIKNAAEVEAERMKREALDNAKREVASMTVDIASLLVKKELNLDDQKALIDAYIDELENAK